MYSRSILTLFALGVLALSSGCSPASEPGDEPSAPTQIEKRGSVVGSYRASEKAFRMGARRGEREGAPSLGTKAFGKHTSEVEPTSEDFEVTSDLFRRDEECPEPGTNQLCVVVSVRNRTASLMKNVYLQITEMRPADAAAKVEDYVGKNNDLLLPAHASAIDGPGAALGLWWVGHIPPGATRRFAMKLRNPSADFTFSAQMWADEGPACQGAASDPPVCGILPETSPGSFAVVDPLRGSDKPCTAGPIPDEYPNDDSQGALGCGNGSLRRPFASAFGALATARPAWLILGTDGRELEERDTLHLTTTNVRAGFDSRDGFASRRAEPTSLRIQATPSLSVAGVLRLEHLRVHAVAPVTLVGGDSAVGVLVEPGGHPTFAASEIRTEGATGGANGTSPSTLAVSGSAGRAAFRGRGGAGATPTVCGAGASPAPGTGGDGGFGEQVGYPGLAAGLNGAPGGAGGGDQTPIGAPGSSGGDGATGSQGISSSGAGFINARGRYSPVYGGSGGAGAPGSPGGGGGGGRGAVRDRVLYRGSGGGGGGGNGCGGEAGTGGLGGGASLGVVVAMGGQVSFDGPDALRVVVGPAGAGGRGGWGRPGGNGGAGGGSVDSEGSRGGEGGRGGAGGAGGGGAGGGGGPAACLAAADRGMAFDGMQCSLPAAAVGGDGGMSGDRAAAPAGSMGLVADVWRLP